MTPVGQKTITRIELEGNEDSGWTWTVLERQWLGSYKWSAPRHHSTGWQKNLLDAYNLATEIAAVKT